MRIVKVVVLSILLVFLLTIWILVASNNNINNYKVVNGFDVKDYEVLNFDSEKNIVDLSITPSINANECGLLEGEDRVVFKKLVNKKCEIETEFAKEAIVYFKDKRNNISVPFKITDYVAGVTINDKYYLPLNATLDLVPSIKMVGNPKIEIKSDSSLISILDNLISINDKGSSTVDIYANGEKIASTTIISTDVIEKRPEEFNLKKPYITCKEYSTEDAALLDEILQYRMDNVGYQTRASAVEAARFLALEFPRRIPYYWENGRLHKTGSHYVDGEGRYYHKGLYLDETKYKDIVASMQGPQMWGCKMINWQDDPPDFYRYSYYPNGLDCSGFVSWSLYNGGFDVGDKGAGPLGGANDLTDLGDMKSLSDNMINSGLIKVGDLFNTSGHISMLVGLDDEHFYIAESLNHYGGVVVRKYKKTRIRGYFQRVILMDGLYKEDGKLTNMWY